MELSGKVVVVTGGGAGIGEAIAQIFLAQGAQVVIAELDAARAEAAGQRLGTPDRVMAVRCDVRKRAEIDRVIEDVLARFQRIDVWVNNAGFGVFKSIVEMDESLFREIFETNFFGVLSGMKAVIPVMTKQGGGTIINLASVGGHIPIVYSGAYSATKSAVIALGKTARAELFKSNVNVLTVCPGYVQAGLLTDTAQKEPSLVPAHVHRNAITPQRVARAVLKGYLKRKREVIVPWTMILGIKYYQLFPRLVEADMVRKL